MRDYWWEYFGIGLLICFFILEGFTNPMFLVFFLIFALVLFLCASLVGGFVYMLHKLWLRLL